MHGEYPAYYDERNVLARCVEGFRNDMKDAYARYDADLEALDRYKGSTGYDEEKAKIDAKLKENTDAIREKYRANFNSIAPNLKKKVGHVGLKAPTTEQINLLTLMKLQSTIDANTLTLAARTLANSPLALEALHNIAKEKGQRFWPLGDEYQVRLCTLDTAGRICDTLNTRIQDLLCYMERPGDKKRYVNDRWTPTALIAYDKDFDTVKECFMAFANIDSEQYDSFFDFISGKDMTDHVIEVTDQALAIDARKKEGAESLVGANAGVDTSADAGAEDYAPTRGFATDALVRYQAELAAKKSKSGDANESDIDIENLSPAEFVQYMRTQQRSGEVLKATELGLGLRFQPAGEQSSGSLSHDH